VLPLPLKPKRVVVKLGTGILTSGVGQLDRSRIDAVCRQIAALQARDIEVIVVSSGAVGLGMGALGLQRRPKDLARVQACAAIGQGRLIQLWQQAFEPHQRLVAQVLLTHDDLRLRHRFLAVREMLERLLRDGSVPVINENDSVSATEIKFGDNDILSSMVASALDAQYLVILSTAPGLIDRTGTKQVIPVVAAITPEIEALAGGTDSVTAVGGMISKIHAAKLAGRSGCGVFIASGSEPDILTRLLAGEGPGTFFFPSGLPMESKKRWLAFFQRPKGCIRVDEGARQAVTAEGKSLLASGVAGSEGDFPAREIVNLAGPDGAVFARGVALFSSREISQIGRKSSKELRELFPDRKRLEVVHRDSLALL
jgi:glutamate 5-kinase